MKLLTRILLIVTMACAPMAHAAFPVHDPVQTAKSIAEMQKQLEEWAKQHEAMQSLNQLNTQIKDYSATLNEYVGDAKKAAQKINEAKELLDRLKKLKDIDDLLDLENEIASLLDITDVKEVLDRKSNIYGSLEDEVGGVKIERKSEDYKRYALTNARVTSYEQERKQTVETMQVIQGELAKALDEARNAQTQAEQLAVLTKIEALNAQLSYTQLRFSTRMYDLHSQTLANADRDLMEQTNYRDVKAAQIISSGKEQEKAYEQGMEELKDLDHPGHRYNKVNENK